MFESRQSPDSCAMTGMRNVSPMVRLHHLTLHTETRLWQLCIAHGSIFPAVGNCLASGLSIVLLLLASMMQSGCASLPDSRVAATPVPDPAISSLPAQRVEDAATTVISPVMVDSVSLERTDEITTLTIVEPGEPEVQIDRASQPDLWSRMRAGFSLPELDSPDVERFAVRFAATNWLEKLGPRARRYLYLLVTEAEKRNLPTELALLPIIESGLNANAQSPAAAAGLCQFIPATGRRFGLHQSALADRRKDVACIDSMYEYLGRNAQMFDGDWLLALAGYNWGEGAVSNAIKRNAKNGLPGDYLSLRMPNETRAYVPQLLALKKLILAPERYGIRLPAVENRPTMDCDVPIPHDIDVSVAARLAGITENEFRQLNAGVRKGIIPRGTHPTICLPFDSAVRFIVNVTEYKGNLASLTTHAVMKRTTLVALAKRYRTTPEAIRAANGIPAGMRLKAGATVLVPRARGDGDIPSEVAATGQTTYEPDVPDTRKLVVRCKRRDTVASISHRYKVSMASLARWNPHMKSTLKTGQKLVLYVPVNAFKPAPLKMASTTAAGPKILRVTVVKNKHGVRDSKLSKATRNNELRKGKKDKGSRYAKASIRRAA